MARRGHDAEWLPHAGAIATREQAISTQAEAIAELRRRAETAEAECDRLALAQAAQDGAGATEAARSTNPPHEATAGAWWRLWRG